MTTGSTRAVAGLLLTGGASSRMGVDKARLRIDGIAVGDRLAGVLTLVAEPVIEVGPGHSPLPSVLEEPRGAGPLVAIAAGRSALFQVGFRGPALVLACDLPFADRQLLEFLADWPGTGSVLPVVAGRAQPLCARWSAEDLDLAAAGASRGERSLRNLPGRHRAALIDEAIWAPVATERAFADFDTPEDLVALGLSERAQS